MSVAIAQRVAPGQPEVGYLPEVQPTPEAAASTPPLELSEVVGLDSFMALQREWDDLVSATDNQPFYGHEFFRIWLGNFEPRADLRVLVARDPQGSLAGALPLLRSRARLLGMPVRQLTSPANDHTPRFDMLARDPEEAGRLFMEQIGEWRGWDLILLRDVPPDGAAWELYRAAQGAGYPVGTWDSLLSPYFEIRSGDGEIEARLDAKFRANLRRRRRKLETHGRVTLERVEGGPHLEARLLESFTLEASGWKGREGTAISQSADTEGFYRELARAASYGGNLALYILRVDGEPVASHYALQYNGRYFLLKPSYSEAYAECSPGHLLMSEVVRDLAARGDVEEFDFLGPDMEWKRDWAGGSARQHRWIFIFNRTPYGRALHRAKFRWAKSRWVQRLKEVAGR